MLAVKYVVTSKLYSVDESVEQINGINVNFSVISPRTYKHGIREIKAIGKPAPISRGGECWTPRNADNPETTGQKEVQNTKKSWGLYILYHGQNSHKLYQNNTLGSSLGDWWGKPCQCQPSKKDSYIGTGNPIGFCQSVFLPDLKNIRMLLQCSSQATFLGDRFFLLQNVLHSFL